MISSSEELLSACVCQRDLPPHTHRETLIMKVPFTDVSLTIPPAMTMCLYWTHRADTLLSSLCEGDTQGLTKHSLPHYTLTVESPATWLWIDRVDGVKGDPRESSKWTGALVATWPLDNTQQNILDTHWHWTLLYYTLRCFHGKDVIQKQACWQAGFWHDLFHHIMNVLN